MTHSGLTWSEFGLTKFLCFLDADIMLLSSVRLLLLVCFVIVIFSDTLFLHNIVSSAYS